jgi:LysR family nod box-dependent transcriptional activator
MDLHQFDLNLLVALDALLTERNVTHAGERVNLGQSAMSGTLARLRRLFHDQLLVTVGRRLVLTPLAQELVDPVREILRLARSAIATQTHFNPATSTHHFSIAASDYATTILLADILRDVKFKAPGITFELLPIGRRAVEDIEAGRLDFLILPERYVSRVHPTERLFEDTYTCVVWSGNQTRYESMPVEQFMNLGHVIVRFGEADAPNWDEQFLRRLKHRRRAEVTTPGFDMAPHLVVGTDRIALLTTRLAVKYAELLPLRLVPFPVRIPPLVEVLQWHKAYNQNSAHMWLRTQIKDVASRMPSPAAAVEGSAAVPRRGQVKRTGPRTAGRAARRRKAS